MMTGTHSLSFSFMLLYTFFSRAGPILALGVEVGHEEGSMTSAQS